VVNAPGQRYHPAIIAQAIGTLAAMYPGRFWAALGSGEASNEHITGTGWPAKPLREARLRECVDVIRALLAGEEVSHRGLVTVDRARCGPSRRAGAVDRRGGQRADRALVRVLGRRVDHRERAGRHLREMISAYRSAGVGVR
jgi:alkanesulfonate monooxygenase SsuD/methylene tetrahydromethanopterin reductase-like flavin-dependent oxidoreductase (luciferase family)